MSNLTAALNPPASSSSTASLSASTSCSRYDVFLNHRGPDVKNTFASHLYRALTWCGLRVFFDKEEMEKGEDISSQIVHAIRGASVHIAIFSPSYAESCWCLDELVEMKDSGATIIPVFHKVKPSVIRHTDKDGQYAEDLRRLQRRRTLDSETGEEKPRYGLDTIQKWKSALSAVADMSGFEYGEEDDEGELLDNIVQRVLNMAPNPPLEVAKYPTGLDLKLEELEMTVLSQHDTERKEAKVVGIVGAGGVGKTTLAKEFFNLKRSNYSSSSFLFDVRETTRKLSLPYLQKKLLTDLKPRLEKDIRIESRDEGVGILKKHLSVCHVLIILDDVDDIDQLEAVLPIKKIIRHESLILITSRDRDVLTKSGVLESSIYILKGMNTRHSKELFCCHAFPESDPLPEFADLVNRFVTVCDGLPLSLKVFGARLCGENELSVWQEILDDLREILPSEIHDKLKISYDSLGAKEKEIFLDIACFFLDEDRDKAIRIWGIVGVRTLQAKCLLEVDSKNKIRMHDHIRDMGRKIAEERSLPRRLWHTNIIDDSCQQLSPIRGIKMVNSFRDVFRDNDPCWYRCWFSALERWRVSPSERLEMTHLFSDLHFTRLRNLQLVATEEDHLEDILSRVKPRHVRWFRWYRCSHSSLPDWVPMENLRVLEMEGDSLNVLWSHQSQGPLQLRQLNILAPLLDIPKSIGQLKYLERIVISNGGKPITVERLPNEFCCLRSLKYLFLKDFSSIVSLPDCFGDLTNLQHICLDGASSLQLLPNSFGHLNRLEHLSLDGTSSLQMLPNSFGDLNRLKCLSLKGASNLQMLPNSFGNLISLETLIVSRCVNLQSIQWLGQVTNLRGLQNVERLTSLENLNVENCQKLQSIEGLGQLTKLTGLHVSGCGEIRQLPGVEHLISLENLNVENCKKLQSIQGMGQLTKLRKLIISLCPEIQELPSVENLRELENLNVENCQKLQSIEGLGQLTKLTGLHVSGCGEIQQLPGVEHLISLENLNVENCKKLQSIQGMGQLTKLRKLIISLCPEIQELPSVENLRELEHLSVRGCHKLRFMQMTKGLEQLIKLRILILFGIEELPGVKLTLEMEHLISLEVLSVCHCKNLQSIQGLGQLTKLGSLRVFKCPEIPELLLGVEHMTSLKTLDVRDCEKLHSIQGLGHLTELTILIVYHCNEILELPGVKHLTLLNEFDVGHCEKLQSIEWLGKLTKLISLRVFGCHEIPELPGVEYLTSLEVLNVADCPKLKSINWLGQLTKLKSLHVSRCNEIRELPDVGHLTSLKQLFVRDCQKLQSIQGLGQLTQLKILCVSGCCEIQNMPGVEHLTSGWMLRAARSSRT